MLKKNIIIIQREVKTPTESQDISTQDTLHYDGPFLITKPSGCSYHPTRAINTWQPLQNAKYAAFLRHYGLPSLSKKELWKYFEDMAKFVKTRNPCQCKSHHKKLLTAFKTVQKVIKQLTDFQGFQELLTEESENIKAFSKEQSKRLSIQSQKGEARLQRENQKTLAMEQRNKQISVKYSPLANVGCQLDVAQEKMLVPTNYVYEEEPMVESKRDYKLADAQGILFLERRKHMLFECQFYFERWVNKVQSLLARQGQ